MSAKRVLHHFPLEPASRLARLVLGEKKLAFEEAHVRYWEPDAAFEALNPSGLTPVLVEEEAGRRLVICETAAILGRADDLVPDPPLLPADPAGRAEARRLVQYFERIFNEDVNGRLLHEKMEKRLLGLGAPDMAVMRAGREALSWHMARLEALLTERDWLAGRTLSQADFAAAANLSVLDYFGECRWAEAPALKVWYMKIKSRPCFRPLLADRLPGMAPCAHYHDLDF